MKKVAFLLLLSLICAVVGKDIEVFAQSSTTDNYTGSVPVVAVRDFTSMPCRRLIENRSANIFKYSDSLTSEEIIAEVATRSDIESMKEGKILTLKTVISPLIYADETEKHVDLAQYDSQFHNVMSFNLTVNKMLLDEGEDDKDAEGTVIDGFSQPMGMAIECAAVDPDEDVVTGCQMIENIDGNLSSVPVIYDEPTNSFVFSTYEFSDFYLYYNLAGDEDEDPTIILPDPAPILNPTPIIPSPPDDPVIPTPVPGRNYVDIPYGDDEKKPSSKNSSSDSSSNTENNNSSYPTTVPSTGYFDNSLAIWQLFWMLQDAIKSQPVGHTDTTMAISNVSGSKDKGAMNKEEVIADEDEIRADESVPDKKPNKDNKTVVNKDTDKKSTKSETVMTEEKQAEEKLMNNSTEKALKSATMSSSPINDVNAPKEEKKPTPVWIYLVPLSVAIIVLIVAFLVWKRRDDDAQG